MNMGRKHRERGERSEIVLDFSKISPNVVLTLVVGLSFLAGFLLGRITAGPKTIARNPSEEKVVETSEGENKGGIKLSEIVKELKADEKKFRVCLSSKKYENKVNSQFTEGGRAGIRGTPGGVLYDMKTGKKKILRGAVPEEELERMLSELKKGQADQEAPQVAKPDPNKDHWKGPKDARYVLIEYSDFQCPFCDRFHPTATEFLKKHKDVAWVYRHFPLRQLHSMAQKLAEASECITEQLGEKGFWKFADKIFKVVRNLSIDY